MFDESNIYNFSVDPVWLGAYLSKIETNKKINIGTAVARLEYYFESCSPDEFPSYDIIFLTACLFEKIYKDGFVIFDNKVLNISTMLCYMRDSQEVSKSGIDGFESSGRLFDDFYKRRKELLEKVFKYSNLIVLRGIESGTYKKNRFDLNLTGDIIIEWKKSASKALIIALFFSSSVSPIVQFYIRDNDIHPVLSYMIVYTSISFISFVSFEPLLETLRKLRIQAKLNDGTSKFELAVDVSVVQSMSDLLRVVDNSNVADKKFQEYEVDCLEIIIRAILYNPKMQIPKILHQLEYLYTSIRGNVTIIHLRIRLLKLNRKISKLKQKVKSRFGQ